MAKNIEKHREKPDLSALYDKLKIPEVGRALIEEIRHGEPARTVRGGKHNVTTRFASKKMGVTIQAEARSTEYAFVLQCEFSPSVLEFYDQPTKKLKMEYRTPQGRKIGHWHTPDFFVITENWMGFIECKMKEELERLANRNPGRFHLDENGLWHCDPGRAAAAQYGLDYRVHFPRLISPQFTRNIQFLNDYLHQEPDENIEPLIAEIEAVVAEKRFIRLDRLIDTIGNSDAVYWAITQQRVAFNLSSDLIVHPERAYVYVDTAFSSAVKMFSASNCAPACSSVSAEAGAELLWDGICWTVLNAGKGSYTLRQGDAALATLSQQQFAELVRDGRIKRTKPDSTTSSTKALEILKSASPEEIQVANQRYTLLNRIASGEVLPSAIDTPLRTLRLWQQRSADAEVAYGNGYLGLIPQTHKRGNHLAKLAPNQIELIEQSIAEHYLTAASRTFREAHINYQALCKTANQHPVSYVTYTAHCKQLSMRQRAQARQGAKAAYQTGPEHRASSISPHGDRAWQTAHIDHTQIEIELVSAVNGDTLHRPWLTILIDSYSRLPLAYVLSFEPPSYRSLMLVMRECVRRHGRLPQSLVTDRGKEFHSIYFESLCAQHRVHLIFRPPAEPRFGAPIERMFGTTQSVFVHDLEGNSKNLHLVRALSASHHPRKLAIWTPEAMDTRLGEWLYEIYPRLIHKGIHETPQSRFDQSVASTGTRSHVFITFDQAFLISTLPGVTTGTRILRDGVIRFNHLDYVSAEFINTPQNRNKLAVRYDPYDPTYVFVQIAKQWHKFVCNDPIIEEYTRRNIRFAHMEIMGRALKSGRAYHSIPELFLDFIRDIREQEKLLLSQRNALRLTPKLTNQTEDDVPDESSWLDDDDQSDTTIDFLKY